MALKRALTLQNVMDADVKTFDFAGEWLDAFGKPQATGVWLVYGGSGSGKTTFVMMLIKYLAAFGRVLFVSYEEGLSSASLKVTIDRLGLMERQNEVLVTIDSVEELDERLSKQRSPDIVVIDSLELSEFNTVRQIKMFADKYPQKLFIYIGQAEGDKPRSELGKAVLFLANQKIYVEGYRAFTRGRSQGEKDAFITIWAERGDKYWEYK